MKLHLFDHRLTHRPHVPERYENLIYGIVLIAGIPVVVIGLSFLTNALFSLFR
jgi:hypothetical protein